MRFDLTELRDLPELRTEAVLRWFGAVMFAVFGGLLVESVVVQAAVRHMPVWTTRGAVAFPFVAVIAVCGLLIFFVGGPPPSGIAVDRDGVTFEFKHRRAQRWDWTRPGFAMQIDATDGVVRRGVKGSAMIMVRGLFPARRYLTRDAYREVVRQARASGLEVSEGPSNIPGFTRTTVSRP
jgi:hypothetical protein